MCYPSIFSFCLPFPRLQITDNSLLPSNMAAARTKTWRLCGIDLRCNRHCLQNLLSVAANSLPVPNFYTCSLAIEYHGRSQTATVSSIEAAELRTSPQPCPEHHEHRGQLVLDDEFLGFTTLFAPPVGDHQVDVIAISGLGRHAFGLLKERNGDYMWLRDALPYDLTDVASGQPMARIMIYGCNSQVAGSRSVQNVDDIAGQLRDSLTGIVSNTSPRPMLVVSHSLGGIIFKEALIGMAASRNDEDVKTLLQAIYGIFFFGVPHLGMGISSLIPMAGEGPNLELVLSIGRDNSQLLERQSRDFPAALDLLGQKEVFCFYESEKSQTAVEINNGEWKMSGPKAILVPLASATACLTEADKRGHVCPIARPHLDMIKYARLDDVYDLVLPKIRATARRAINPSARPGSLTGNYGTSRAGKSRQSDAVWSIPMPKNENFTGHESDMAKLRDAFFPEATSRKRSSTITLTGIRGVGKTQVALALSYWVKEHRPDYSIFWLSALSMETFERSCASALDKLGVSATSNERSDAKKELREYLCSSWSTRKWLLVLDNADDPSLPLLQYLPRNDSSITLITTRTNYATYTMVSRRNIVRLGLLNENEAMMLLDRSLGKKAPWDYKMQTIRELVTTLELLPLAITQAAAYISFRKITIRTYLRHLQGQSEAADQLLGFGLERRETWAQRKEYRAVVSNWLVCVDEILRRDQAQGSDATTKLLMFLSEIEPEAIPRSILPEYCAPQTLTNTIDTLLSYSLLSKREDDVYDMNSLVHLAIQSWVWRKDLEIESRERALAHLTTLIASCDLTAPAEWTGYMPHALRALTADAWDTGGRLWLAAAVQRCLKMEGRHDDALRWAVVVSDGIGRSHEDMFLAKHHLAWAYIGAGKAAAAVPVFQVVIQYRQFFRRFDDHMLRHARLGLGKAYTDSGHYSKALEVLDDVLSSTPIEHKNYSAVQGALGHVHIKTGEMQKGIQRLESALLTAREHLPPGHLTACAAVIVCAHLAAGQPAAALSLLQDLVKVCFEVHPSRTLTRLQSQYHLAGAYLAMAMFDEAMTTLKHSLQLTDILQLTRPLLGKELQLHLKTLVLLRDVFEAVGDTDSEWSLEAEIDAARYMLSETDKLNQRHGGLLGYILWVVWGLIDKLWALFGFKSEYGVGSGWSECHYCT
ncbi:protein SERAC1 [Microdochium nivale]|nr:protein SERAC1 [Microdochium nivale]